MGQEVDSLGTQALLMPSLVVDKVALQVVLKVVWTLVGVVTEVVFMVVG